METLTVVLSIVALIISIIAILWTVYEKIFLKPRSKVTGLISFIKHGDYESKSMLTLNLVNYGPGKIIIESIAAHNLKLFGKLLKRNTYAFIINDYTNEYNCKLPHEIEQYQRLTQFLPINKKKLFDEPMNRFGFKDTIGRFHFIKKSSMKKLIKEYDENVIKLIEQGKEFED